MAGSGRARSCALRRLLAAALASLPLAAAAPAPPPLRLVDTIPLPGVSGRIDHLAADLEGRRLFVAALGNHTIEVVDLVKRGSAARIGGLDEPQGLAFERDPARLVVATAGGAFRVFDGGTLRPLRALQLGEDADNVRYDASRRETWVGYGAGALAVITADGHRGPDIPLPGHPESFQLEEGGPRVFVNVPSAGSVEVVDRLRRRVIGSWSLGGARGNYPMALDEIHRRVFVGCRRPARLLVYDSQSGRRLASLPIGGDADDLFFDGARRRLYVSSGAGEVDVFAQSDADHYRSLGAVATAPGARTALWVESWSRLYVAAPRRADRSAEILVFSVEPQAR